MLIRSQFEGSVTLVKPTSGQFDELKWDTFNPNLLMLNDLVTSALETSNGAMSQINLNSRNMNVELENNIKYLSLKSSKIKPVLIKNCLQSIQDFAAENVQEANRTINKFEKANRFIAELQEAIVATDSVSKE